MDKHELPTTLPYPPPAGPVMLQRGVEVIAGYRLESFRGGGTFGEVWEVVGPGGVHLAQKFVRMEAGLAEVEARALEFMKGVRNPHLLGIFGIWHRETLLVVGMELAEQSLSDRLRKARDEGLPGIPFGELIEHLSEAAKGIDFLNEPRHTVAGRPGLSIVHCDVKPQNLLLLGGGVKVADFGLAGVIERSITGRTGGMTTAYAAPEFFQGQVSKYSDQYSLAATYYHLRTGRLPFPGNAHQMMAGHLLDPPDLMPLPEAERNVVGKALAKRPHDRWPSCRHFAEQLKARGSGAPQTTSPHPAAMPSGRSLQADQRGPCLGPLLSVAQFTERIWPLVVEEMPNGSQGDCYKLHDLGPPQPGAQQPIRLGSRVFWSVLWDKEAHLLLLDEDPEGKVFCLCPSWFVPDTRLRPGRTLLPPESARCEPFVVTGIPGREHLLAVLTREPLPLDWMPPHKNVPARVVSREDVNQLLAVLQGLKPGSWVALTTYCDVVV
jgi:hypothetical protein